MELGVAEGEEPAVGGQEPVAPALAAIPTIGRFNGLPPIEP
jgi:hypothetical protein